MSDPNINLNCYVNADFARLWNHKDDQNPVCVKSKTGYVFIIAGCPVYWSSKLQNEIALSTLEAEYIVLSTAMQEMLPMQRLFQEIRSVVNLKLEEKGLLLLVIFEDNTGVLELAMLPKLTLQMKHITDHIGEKKGIRIAKIDTKFQKADTIIKGLPFENFGQIHGLMMRW